MGKTKCVAVQVPFHPLKSLWGVQPVGLDTPGCYRGSLEAYHAADVPEVCFSDLRRQFARVQTP